MRRTLTVVGIVACGMAMMAAQAPTVPQTPTAPAPGTVAASTELKVGDPAPAFELAGSDGQTHSLAEHRGKRAVVLAWYPKAFTGG